jgi:hypothetical protein
MSIRPTTTQVAHRTKAITALRKSRQPNSFDTRYSAELCAGGDCLQALGYAGHMMYEERTVARLFGVTREQAAVWQAGVMRRYDIEQESRKEIAAAMRKFFQQCDAYNVYYNLPIG